MNKVEYHDCIFLDAREFDLLEQDLPDATRADFAQKGHPRVQLPDGAYEYIPVISVVTGKQFYAVRGKRIA